MKLDGIELTKISDNLFEIPKSGKMRVPGRVYFSEHMIKSGAWDVESLKQVMNVAHLPGIQRYSIAMPDIHWGYGFPIGGVCATDCKNGVVSPGGVGYDINCGVRLASTGLEYVKIKEKIPALVNKLFDLVPTGVGGSGAIRKLEINQIKRLLLQGSSWAVEMGYGRPEDVHFTEEHGFLRSASTEAISEKAFERGLSQVGSLGSGNHFLEVGVVQEIYDEFLAAELGLFKGQVTVLIHTGSRGFGYQICEDFIKVHLKAGEKYGISLPDRQLACAPIDSPEGQDYFTSMSSAANFAWNNRQVIMSMAKKAFMEVLAMGESDLDFRLVYDVCHNIAKMEEHQIEGKSKKVCVHRKGATRAFAPGSSLIPEKYRKSGQPVLIPGDMGRYSYVCVGTEKAMQETFGSSCHGAGRLQSRKKASQMAKGRDLLSEMRKNEIIVRARSTATLGEEMSEAYKDVSDVVDVMHNAGITLKVAKLKPVGVVKG